MAQGQDDLRVGEQPQDHRQAEHVEWILVDQLLAGRQADHLRHFGPVHRAQVVGGRRIHPVQRVRILEAALLHVLDAALQRGALVHRGVCRVGVQHLFQHGGAGTREADDENGRCFLARCAWVVAEAAFVLGEPLAGDLQRFGIGVRDLGDHVLGEPEVDRVRLLEVRHGGLRVLQLVGDAGQGEMRIGFGLHMGLQGDDLRGRTAGGVVVLAAHRQRGFQVQQVDLFLAACGIAQAARMREQRLRLVDVVGTFVELGEADGAGERLSNTGSQQ